MDTFEGHSPQRPNKIYVVIHNFAKSSDDIVIHPMIQGSEWPLSSGTNRDIYCSVWGGIMFFTSFEAIAITLQ